jgi:hypothetical protein
MVNHSIMSMVETVGADMSIIKLIWKPSNWYNGRTDDILHLTNHILRNKYMVYNINPF